jgi:putative effector of murein hydrolase LrgA (UPF0299 family)
MLVALFALLGCQLAGEVLRNLLHLPIPGPVIGMILLTAGLAVRDRNTGPDEARRAPSALDRLSGVLLRHMGLLFVPAGVGLVAATGLLEKDWLPIAGGVVGSTALSLAVTGFVMHRFARTGAKPADGGEASS